jgi:hypothetical protein
MRSCYGSISGYEKESTQCNVTPLTKKLSDVKMSQKANDSSWFYFETEFNS